MNIAISWIILSYLLGSLPFGYLVAKLYGVDILKVGTRQIGGTNVFRNVGKWQGILSGILDFSKGFAVVFGAQKLGFSSGIQILAGVAAIAGHNWSIYLKFAGGRGIATCLGAFLALSPKIFGFSLIPLVILTIIWSGSIGTLLFFIVAILLSIYFSQFETAGVFIILSLVPIAIKRLSPIQEISQSENPATLIRNRLIFDNDRARFNLRIKRLFKKL